jgi:hypothetical protein
MTAATGENTKRSGPDEKKKERDFIFLNNVDDVKWFNLKEFKKAIIKPI